MQSVDVAAVLGCAGLAPSVHNTQPWQFSASEDRIEVTLVADRQLRWADPNGRLARISCGAAAEFGRLAVRGCGRSSDVEAVDSPNRPYLVARITIGGDEPVTPAERDLLDAMPRRYTDRGPYQDRPVADSVLDAIGRLTAPVGVWMKQLELDDRALVAQILEDAEAVETADPRYREELDRWIRTRTTEDGVPLPAVPSWPTDRVSDMPLRDFVGGARSHDAGAAPPRIERDTVVMLLTADDRPLNWVAAGRALALLTLQAAAADISCQPLGPATDRPETRQRLRDDLGLVGRPQLLLRMGFGAGQPWTGRRGLTPPQPGLG